VHEVEVTSGQFSNRMVLGELGEAPNSLVDILFLYQIFRDASKILQARVAPKLGKAMLQGLNSMLHEEHHELNTQQCASFPSFKSLNARQQRSNLFYFCI
jgi:hypothetical protein